MSVSDVWGVTVTRPGRIDVEALRGRLDLRAVITADRGPADRAGKWLCPFHDDHNPSLSVAPNGRHWQCWSCGAKGDAIGWVRAFHRVGFREACARLDPSLGPPAARPGRHLRAGGPNACEQAKGQAYEGRRTTPSKTPARPVAGPVGQVVPTAGAVASVSPAGRGKGDKPRLSPEAAGRLVDDAAGRLWTPEGATCLAYLRGRGLADETIRGARLGWTPAADGVSRSRKPPALVIPWFDDRGALIAVKFRPDDQWRALLDPDERKRWRYRNPIGWGPPATFYPRPATVRPWLPVVIVEGELDALRLGQEMAGLASVVTLGSASSGGPTRDIRRSLSSCPRWFIATDADEAGEKAAAPWLAYGRARRVRPPAPFKDWTDAGQDARGSTGTAVNLRRWWSSVLAGIDAPPLYTLPELARQRWGPAANDPEPGIDSRGPADPFDLAERLAEARADEDAYAIAEREALQWADEETT